MDSVVAVALIVCLPCTPRDLLIFLFIIVVVIVVKSECCSNQQRILFAHGTRKEFYFVCVTDVYAWDLWHLFVWNIFQEPEMKYRETEKGLLIELFHWKWLSFYLISHNFGGFILFFLYKLFGVVCNKMNLI